MNEEEQKQQISKKEIRFDSHLSFFKRCMQIMPSAYQGQEVNRLTLSYFIISGLDILGKIDLVEKEKTINWIYSLQVLPDKDDPEKNFENCGFRGSGFVGIPYNPKCEPTNMHPHDQGHIAMNYCALAILAMLGDDYSRVNKQAILKSMKKMQQEDGSFACVNNGAEMDMRFVYCACVVSYLLNDWSGIDQEKATNYILAAQNYDYGFGQGGSKESHGGSTFCAIASLYLMNKIHLIPKKEKLIEWLIQRQYTGFEGRINKPPDVCYSFWIGGSLKMLEAWDLINFEHLRSFLFDCQGEHIGGFSKLVGNNPDVLHSYYALCGLSFGNEQGLLEIVPSIGITKRAYDNWSKIKKN